MEWEKIFPILQSGTHTSIVKELLPYITRLICNIWCFGCSENGEVKTWGWGEHGQLGLGDTCDRISPDTVSLGYDLNEAASIRVYCGSGFTFALTMP
ncbi:uncharacterized protein LOC130735198 [Lotus japonicus]|uniref:uncharacterized protein LOC130735198 n=1 Tax=Lotus japonicus TaxID=34305 RepID=UPI00258DA8BF|nr:uncharacterized protein LOC130735198 [Lotus japonicus]